MRFKKKQDHISYTVSMLCLVAQSCATLCHPMDCSPPGSSVHGDSPCKSGLPFPSLGDLFNPGIQSRSLTLQADSLLPEILGKPKNTGVGNLPCPGHLPNPGIKPGSPALQADSLPVELLGKPLFLK